MKLRIETFITLSAMTVILLAGCVQKTKQPTHIDTSPEVTQTPKTPDDYLGDPYLYIANIEYETIIRRHDVKDSRPILPRKIQNKLAALYLQWEEGSLTEEEHKRMRHDIISEELGYLDTAKYIILEKWYPESAAAEYAQKALEQKPNDYNTIYVWTETRTDPAEKVEGLRKLLAQNPNSPEILFHLGVRLLNWETKTHKDYEELIGYLKRSAALAPDLYRGGAYRKLGKIYLDLKDKETALAYYKRAQEIYDLEITREYIELIEKGELPFSFFGLLGCGNTQEKTAPQEIQAPIDTQTEVSQPSTVSKDAEQAPESSANAKIYYRKGDIS